MIKNVGIVTLGCAKNEIDSELMNSLLRDNNYRITNYLDEAHIIIVNTCSFILDAKEESIETILELSSYKVEGSCRFLILAGCLAERYSKELLEEIPEIDGIIGTGNIKDIVNLIESLKAGIIKPERIQNINEEYPEEVKRVNFRRTEYLQISEGCDNHCSYCIIPKLRGKYRSRKMDNIVEEAEWLVKNGVRELILIGQNTTDYGIDLYGEYRLAELLDRLNEIENLKWIRLLYLYPDNFTDELITAIKANDKVVKYVDLPLQHINNNILRRMNRKTSREDVEALIYKLREEITDIVIRTTFIVGFPGETEEDFQELKEFIGQIKFDKLGVFPYSREEDTPAYNFKNQVDEEVKDRRKNELMALQQVISSDINKGRIGSKYMALIEEELENNGYIGRAYMDAPEIDGIIYIESQEKLKAGNFVNLTIIDSLEYDLIGEISNEPSK